MNTAIFRPGCLTMLLVLGLLGTLSAQDTSGSGSSSDQSPSDPSELPIQACNNKLYLCKPCETESGPICFSEQSTIAPNLRYRHYAWDYRVEDGAGSDLGCTPCGAGGGESVEGPLRVGIHRFHFPDTDLIASFGPNWGAGFDLWLRCYPPGTVASGRPTGVAGWQILVQEPQTSPVDFHVAVDGDGDGVYADVKPAFFAALRFFDVADQLVTTPVDAASAILDRHDGSTWHFEVYRENPSDPATTRGRLRFIEDRNGNRLESIWKYAVDDPSLTGTLRTKLRIRESLTDAHGRTLHFTYNETTQVAGQWVVERIDLPTGDSVHYQYGTVASSSWGTRQTLTGVTHPDGSQSTFSAVLDPSTSTVLWSCDDPAAEPTSRVKQVYFSTSPWKNPANPSQKVGQIFNRVRQIRNGDGELTFQGVVRQFLVGGVNESRTYVNNQGRMSAIVHQFGDGPTARYERLGGDGNPLWWLTQDWSGWQQVLDLEPGPQRLGSVARVDGVGNATATVRDPITDLPLSVTHPDGSTETWAYNSFQQVLVHVDRLGRRTEHVYDAAGNRLSTTRGAGTPEASTWTYAYWQVGDADPEAGLPGQLKTAVDANGNATAYFYFPTGDLKRIVHPADVAGDPQPVQAFAYDAAGRRISQTDPAGRLVTFTWDARSRVTAIGYADGSEESWDYATAGPDAGLLIARQDRNGNETRFGYDLSGRRIAVTEAFGTPEAVATTCTYLPGNLTLKASETRHGELTTHQYDSRLRRIATIVHPRDGVALTTTFAYDNADRLVEQTDPYGRRTFRVYDVDDRLVRVIRELIPGGFAGDPATAARVTTANPLYTIEETAFDAEGQVLARIDGRGIRAAYGYDAQGRVIEQITAEAQESAPGVFDVLVTPEAARTVVTYDAQGNRLTQTLPRSFTRLGDGTWVNGTEGVFQTTWTYTGRNLLASETVADGLDAGGLVRSERATTTQTYSPTGKVTTMTDARGFVSTYVYAVCCDRLVQTIDPVGAVTAFGYDHHGNRTSVTDGNGNTTAWTYDARHRVATQTNGAGETTTYAYDDDLTDGVGLDAVYAGQIADLDLVAGLADGSAVAMTNPAGETSVQIQDGLGRTVRTIDGNGNAVSMQYDSVVAGLVETVQIDGVGSQTRSRADGQGLVRQALDAEDQMSFQFFDANGNRVQVRDPSGVGMDCTYDARNREVHCQDTRSDVAVVRLTQFDSHGNVVQATDALGASESFVFDARDRRISHTDRIAATTLFAYDPSDNLTTIVDAEGGITNYAYDERNLLVWERFPQGQRGKTVRAYEYDLGRRLMQRTVDTDPASSFMEVTQYAYDAANRLVQRGYQDGLNDGFQYDLASRLTVATSGRYQNQVERLYDSGGRLTGEWLIGQGNSALPAAWSVWYGYDAANRVRTLTYPNGTEVTRDYTARHQLEAVTHGGTPVATRSYDAAGKLTQTVLGNGLSESRSYLPDSHLVATIAVPGVTAFSYQYDANGRKTTEANAAATPNPETQNFQYDDQDRLTSWSKDAGVVPAQTQEWNLTLVGDWQSTTRDGVLEARQHTDVHEVTRIKVGTGLNRLLRYDAKGNLTKDDANRRYTWDPENRLQTARTPKAISPTGQNLRSEYVYDALGRRVAKTVNGRVTRFIHTGAQVIQEEEGQAIAPPAERRGDGDLAALAEEPASGGILPAATDPSAPVLRINFQPRTTMIPPGFLADKGKKFAARTNGLSYGWSANLQNPDRIQRFAASLEEWDTFLRAARPGRPQRTWRIALPNGTYPVIVVAGDAVSRNHTNHLIIGGIPVTDSDPATMDTGYELGDFDGYAVQATVTNGFLTIAPGVGAFDPTVCFIEIGPEGTTITPDAETQLTDLVESMTTATYAPQAPSLARRQYVYGTYVDELLSYVVGAGSSPQRYFVHANHLYSPAATTDGTGAVVERYTYDAYGQQSITSGGGVARSSSAVAFSRGFTGYILDPETGLYHASNRKYSSTLGRFVSRDPAGYVDGPSLYMAYFAPNGLDPWGLWKCDDGSEGKLCDSGWIDEPAVQIVDARRHGSNFDWGISWGGVRVGRYTILVDIEIRYAWYCTICCKGKYCETDSDEVWLYDRDENHQGGVLIANIPVRVPLTAPWPLPGPGSLKALRTTAFVAYYLSEIAELAQPIASVYASTARAYGAEALCRFGEAGLINELKKVVP